MKWDEAADIRQSLEHILPRIDMPYIDMSHLRCFRSFGSTSRARARIWSFPKIWQQALKLPPHYVIEVISERFDTLSTDDKARVLIHELLHIPKNFSGALRPHKMHKWRLNDRLVETYFKEYKSSKR